MTDRSQMCANLQNYIHPSAPANHIPSAEISNPLIEVHQGCQYELNLKMGVEANLAPLRQEMRPK